MFDVNKIKSDLSNLSRGQSYVYFTGHIADDNNPYKRAAYDIAEFAYYLYENGRIHLFQKKIDDGMFDYIAVGRY